MKKIAIVNLGCPKNLIDSETMAGLLAESGYSLVTQPERAETIIINTCGFIDSAKEESIDTILAMAEYKKEGACKQLLVTGCLAQRFYRELAQEIPEIDGIMGTGSIDRIGDLVAGQKLIMLPPNLYGGQAELKRRVSTTPYGYLKIAEGCNNNCSYCVIPVLRGRLRSKTLEQVVAEAGAMAAKGIKEIVLIAQDTSQYGVDISGKSQLPELLAALEAAPYQVRYRLLYCYPDHLTSALIKSFTALSKFSCYLDIPFQHCNPKILARMGRQTSPSPRQLIEELRQHAPNISLRSTFIVGFPGESDAQFRELLDFIRWAEFDHLGAFMYSPEPGTPAGRMKNQIPQPVKKQRYHQLMSLQQQIVRRRNLSQQGKCFSVLIDYVQRGVAYGRSYREAPEIDSKIIFPASKWEPGDFVQVRCTGYQGYDLLGEIDNG